MMLMKYKEALKIISEYIHIDDKDEIVMRRQCGKSKMTTYKIIQIRDIAPTL